MSSSPRARVRRPSVRAQAADAHHKFHKKFETEQSYAYQYTPRLRDTLDAEAMRAILSHGGVGQVHRSSPRPTLPPATTRCAAQPPPRRRGSTHDHTQDRRGQALTHPCLANAWPPRAPACARRFNPIFRSSATSSTWTASPASPHTGGPSPDASIKPMSLLHNRQLGSGTPRIQSNSPVGSDNVAGATSYVI